MLTEDGLLASALDDDACVTLAEGDVSSGGRLTLSSRKDGSSAADGPRTLGPGADIDLCAWQSGARAVGPQGGAGTADDVARNHGWAALLLEPFHLLRPQRRQGVWAGPFVPY